ncbi:hypothetical protein [Mucilaginibacter sp. UYCu711]|uniref:hypothetical protein n=1 Tax=Mucilaginibacter sp. UYCu711 TaxID=3156339 RepID=UPI003D1CD144
MKKILLMVIFGLAGQLCRAQKLDTIFVNIARTSYVICHDSISYFEVGSKQYTGIVKGDAFFLKPLGENTEPTGLLIRTSSGYISKIVAYSNDSKKKYMYDLGNNEGGGKEINRDGQRSGSNHKEASDKTAVIDSTGNDKKFDADLDNKLKSFVAIVSPYKTITTQKERVILSMGNIKLSGDKLYIKLIVSNYNQHRFMIDKTQMVYLNQAGDLLGSNTSLENQLEVIQQLNTPAFVDFKETKLYGFVMDAGTVKGKGKLLIEMTERNSSRVLILEVPSSLFIKN